MVTYKLSEPFLIQRELTSKAGVTFGKFTPMTLEVVPPKAFLFAADGRRVIVPIRLLHEVNPMFVEIPGNDEMEHIVCSSVCPTLTGDDVEPDGVGPDGMPSILMALGLV